MAIPADSGLFIAAMRRAATAVSVVATSGPAGRFAVTVSAIASVSADPPILLACINRRSPVSRAIRINRVFTVSLLTCAQVPVAETFAGRPGDFPPFDFACADWDDIGDPGVPCLSHALSAFHCHLHHAYDAGTHTVVLGRVTEAIGRDAMPLIYTDRTYAAPQPITNHLMITETQP